MPDSLPPQYAPLFEPLKIGPVTAPNRFYQVPHCTGMGYMHPATLAAMRGIKAEGGWGVVCTEYCSIHPTSDDRPYPFASLWDEEDVRAQAAMTEAVHRHGSLAGVELWHGGTSVANLHSREPTFGPASMPSRFDPLQSARMDLADIRALRHWHREAAKRALNAGFDIVYVYAAHGYLLSEFLSRSLNQRGDEYGGSLSNRLRLVRELLEETREVVDGRAALAIRFQATGAGDAHMPAEESREAVAMLADLPDLWDLTVEDYSEEMGSSRYVPQGALAERVSWVRELTGRPSVTVGRYTAPDQMVALLRRGLSDLVGAARPSIADPFLPSKIREGRFDEIRECIGCNVCYSGDTRGVPIRCTQNPTMGEEWRRGWHPERVPPGRAERVLVVGAGPAGLEATHILSKRGFKVMLAEAGSELGGRVTRESRLPGLGEWARVRDYRLGRIEGQASVEIFRDSRLAAADVLSVGARRVLIATGARWRGDGIGRWHANAVPGSDGAAIFTPDDVMAGRLPAEGPVLLFDDDDYYMGPVLALALRAAGLPVILVTTRGVAGGWSVSTAEQARTQAALIEAGVTILVSRALVGWQPGEGTTACVFTGRESRHEAAALLLVTGRVPEDELWRSLTDDAAAAEAAGIETLARIGDCHAPGIIAAAVYAGHKAARELGETLVDARRDRALIGARSAD